MAPVYLATALLVLLTALASAPVVAAQDSSYPGPALPTRMDASGDAGCARGITPNPPAYASDQTVCRPAGAPDMTSRDSRCTSLGSRPSGFLYISRIPYYAQGGEAYSYAGYGSEYSPYVTAPSTTVPASGDSRLGSTTSAACSSPLGSAVSPGAPSARLTRPDLATIGLPAPTAFQRGTDLRDPDLWLVQTREGPIVQRVLPDGRRAFTPGPTSTSNGSTIWRPWDPQDRPAVDHAWQSFAVWWTDQGRAWPPT